MTNDPIVTQLYRRANGEPRPLVLRIGDDEVLPLARYAQMMTHPETTVVSIAEMIRAGGMKFFGIPVWVRT